MSWNCYCDLTVLLALVHLEREQLELVPPSLAPPVSLVVHLNLNLWNLDSGVPLLETRALESKTSCELEDAMHLLVVHVVGRVLEWQREAGPWPDPKLHQFLCTWDWFTTKSFSMVYVPLFDQRD